MEKRTLIKPPFEMRDDLFELHFENGISVEFSWKGENLIFFDVLVYRESDNRITDLTYKFSATGQALSSEEFTEILRKVSEVGDVKDIV